MKINMIKKSIVITAALAATVGVGSAQAVTYGELDGEGHPYVGLMVFEDAVGMGLHRCSGALLSSTVMITAGHCTFGTEGGHVWFESDVGAGMPDNGYPDGGGTSFEFAEIHTHPDYQDDPSHMYDVGVVILNDPVSLDVYGELAPLGFLDRLLAKRGLKNKIFNPVGYGLQSFTPEQEDDRVRYTGEVMLIGANGPVEAPDELVATFTNNPSKRVSGGTCLGDSGGPYLHDGTDTIAAIIGFGNPACSGVDTGFRVDIGEIQDFIYQFLDN